MIAEANALMQRGEFLAAHDRAMAAIAAGAEGLGPRHLAVLALARAGALVPAWAQFERLGLARSDDPEIRGLGARLLKDLALASNELAHARAAARASSRLFRATREGWHGINAAAMLLLAGRRRAAGRLAGRVAALEDRGDYWSAATSAEAALLSGDLAATARHLSIAEARGGTDLAARASTRRQMRWEAARLGFDPAVLNNLRIPAVIHYSGLIPGGPGDEAGLLDALGPVLAGVGHGFGGLAAGADLVIAEALLAAGARVTAILPFPPDAYEAASVRLAGEAWVGRFRAAMARAEVVVLETAPFDDCDFQLASRRAMGRARLTAAALDAPVFQVAVSDGGAPRGPAGTAADIAVWRASGGETRLVASPWPRRPPAWAPTDRPAPRAVKAVLFGDLPRFGALDDAALIRFYGAPMVAFGAAVDRAGPIYRNAWGDAVQAVFDQPEAAARCAMMLARAVPAGALAAAGLPEGLTPRLALDFGALAPVFDAVQQVAKFAGRVMTRAARIEPVTPPGSVYATEAFACEIALARDCGFVCDYAGLVATAKGFGLLPLYALRTARKNIP